jgi:hypothetical protein
MADQVGQEKPAARITLNDDPILGPQVDITGPVHGVQIQYSGSVLWVNVDGICRFRICQIDVPVHVENQVAGTIEEWHHKA